MLHKKKRRSLFSPSLNLGARVAGVFDPHRNSAYAMLGPGVLSTGLCFGANARHIVIRRPTDNGHADRQKRYSEPSATIADVHSADYSEHSFYTLSLDATVHRWQPNVSF